MNKTSREIGREEGTRQLLTEQLEERFGQLPETIVNQLQTMNEREIRRIGKAMIKAQSLNELGLES